MIYRVEKVGSLGNLFEGNFTRESRWTRGGIGPTFHAQARPDPDAGMDARFEAESQ